MQVPARVYAQAVTLRIIAALFLVAALVGARTPAAPAPAQTDVSDAALERASEARTVDIGLLSTGGGVATIPLEVYVARVLAGEAEPGAADLMTLFPLTTMRHFSPRDIAPYPNIRAYIQRLAARPAYQRAAHAADPGFAVPLA